MSVARVLRRREAWRASIAVEARVAPTEFRIFKMGPNVTDHGTHTLDEKSARKVMQEYKSRGMQRLAFDYDHKSLVEGGEAMAGRAAGSFVPQVRDDGLWATDIHWTESAKTAIEAGEWLYFSPAYSTEKSTGRIVALVNVALTNVPATHGLAPLVAATAYPWDECIAEHTANQSRADMLNDADKAMAADWLAAVKDIATKAEDPSLKELATGVADALAKLMGDGAGDAADAAAASKAETQAIAASARAMFGAKSAAEIQASAKGLEALQASHASLAKEVSDMRGKANASEVRDIIAANRERITPALESWAASQSPDALRAFVKVAPIVVQTSAVKPPEAKSADVTLTPEELHCCSLMGRDPAKVLATKIAMGAGKVN